MKRELLTDLGEYIDSEEGGLFRFVAPESVVHRKCGLKPPSGLHDDYHAQIENLRYSRPKAFTCLMAYLAWREMDKFDGGYVLFHELEQELVTVARRFLVQPQILIPDSGG